MATNPTTEYALGNAVNSRDDAATIMSVVNSSGTSLPSINNTVTTGTGTMVSGAMEGASSVTLTASGQAGITLTTRTAAQIQANVPGWKVGQTYKLKIVNNNTGTLTTAGGANVTMTSTIPAGYAADYTVLFATATTITVTQILVSPTNAANALVNGVGVSYKIARGVAAVTGTATVVTGLTTVVSVIATASSDLDGDTLAGVSATIGDQAGSPAAGSVILKCWKVTTGGAAGNPTLIAAGSAKNVNWEAIGT